MSKGIRIIVVLLVAITMCGLIIYDIKHNELMDAQRAKMLNLADDAVKEHVWDRDDYLHWESIANKPQTGIPDADLDWLLSKMTEPSPPPGAIQSYIDTNIIATLHDAALTPSQIVKVDAATLPLLGMDNEPDDQTGLITEYACHLFQKYPDPRAVPYLLVLLNSPHPWTRLHAALALNVQGYHVPVPPKPKTW